METLKWGLHVSSPAGPSDHPGSVLPDLLLHGLPVPVLRPCQHRDRLCHFPYWYPSLLPVHRVWPQTKVAPEMSRYHTDHASNNGCDKQSVHLLTLLLLMLKEIVFHQTSFWHINPLMLTWVNMFPCHVVSHIWQFWLPYVQSMNFLLSSDSFNRAMQIVMEVVPAEA